MVGLGGGSGRARVLAVGLGCHRYLPAVMPVWGWQRSFFPIILGNTLICYHFYILICAAESLLFFLFVVILLVVVMILMLHFSQYW